MARLIISTDGRDKEYEIIDERFTIGSGPEADLCLTDPEISSIHLTVDKTRNGYRIVDMETKHGTLVNGRQANQHILANGDTIQIGSVKITYMGRGGARPAARKKAQRKGPALESSHYYRHANAKETSSGARLAIIGSIILGIVFLLWIALGATQPPESDRIRAELGEALRLCDEGTVHQEKIVAVINKYNNKDLDDFQLKQLRKLRTEWKRCQEAAQGGRKSTQAQSDWMKIHNVQMSESSNRDKLKKMCEEYIEKYSDTQGKAQLNIKRAKAIIADLESQGEMTADEKEFARIEELMREPMRLKDHHAAMRVLKSIDPDVKAGNPERWEKLYRRIRIKSRRFLGKRKNDVKGYLRKDEDIVDEKKNPEIDIYDPAKARQVAIDTIFTKLLHEVIRDYLNSPDNYRSKWNQNAELRTRALFRELLKEIKPNY